MKKIIKILIVAVIICIAGLTANAQSSTNSIISTIVTDGITIEKLYDMNFGNILVKSDIGTVILSTSNMRTASGGVILPNISGDVTSSSFVVTGEKNYIHSITFQNSDITISSSNHLNVGSFNIDNTEIGKLNDNGQQVINIGATLYIGSNHVMSKDSSLFYVIVNCN